MEAIDAHLKQLEAAEIQMMNDRKQILQQRLKEDEALHAKRQEEDRVYLDLLKARDQEEDNLRHNRRLMSRSLLADPASISDHLPVNLPAQIKTGSDSSGKAKKKKKLSTTIAKKTSHGKKDIEPVGKDGQGNLLFSRPSDGKLVYLRCCVDGCLRTDFPNPLSLVRHVSAPHYHHKQLGRLNSSQEAIEVCGEVAPGQEDNAALVARAIEVCGAVAPGQEDNATLVARAMSNIASNKTSASPNVSSKGSSHEAGMLSEADTLVECEVGGHLSAQSKPALAGAARLTPQDDGPFRGTRAQQAKEVFDGFLSSESEDGEEDVNITMFSAATGEQSDLEKPNKANITRRNNPSTCSNVSNGAKEQHSQDSSPDVSNGVLKEEPNLRPSTSLDVQSQFRPVNAATTVTVELPAARDAHVLDNASTKRATPPTAHSPPSKRICT